MRIGSLDIKINIKGGKESIATMEQLKATTLKTKVAMIAAVVALAKMSQEARRLAMNLEVFETATGITGDALQKMSFRAAAAGVSLDNYGDTLQRIQQMTMAIARGEGDVSPFAINQIGISKDPIKVLDQIQARLKQFHATDPARAAQLAQDFGLSNEMMYALLKGQTEEIESQWLLKAKDKDALVTLNKEWYKLWWYVKQIGIRLQGFLAHVAIPIVKACIQIVKAVGEIAIAVGEWVQKSKWVKYVLGLIAAGVVALLAYIWPIPAAIALIAVALEDVYGYFTGKDSITGRMLEWITSGQILKDIFMTIAEIIRSISKALFGANFTKKAANFLTGGGKAWNIFDFNPLSIGKDLAGIAKPALASGFGGLNITQHNTANFVSSGNLTQDGEAAGAMFNESAVSDATLQQSDIAREMGD